MSQRCAGGSGQSLALPTLPAAKGDCALSVRYGAPVGTTALWLPLGKGLGWCLPTLEWHEPTCCRPATEWTASRFSEPCFMAGVLFLSWSQQPVRVWAAVAENRHHCSFPGGAGSRTSAAGIQQSPAALSESASSQVHDSRRLQCQAGLWSLRL